MALVAVNIRFSTKRTRYRSSFHVTSCREKMRRDATYEPPRGKTNNVVSEQVRHKRAVQAQKMARRLKCQMKVGEGFYYPCRQRR